MDLTIASFDAISEVNMVSSKRDGEKSRSIGDDNSFNEIISFNHIYASFT